MAPPVRYCIPGERLCNLEEGSPGSGTYTRHGYIFSSLAGCLMKSSENGALPVVSVVRETESQLLPDVGAIVTCKVSSINSRFAKVHILYVGSMPLKNSFRGTIRKEDVRATEKDKVEIYKSFRPGDIVLAKVISLGDAQSNYLLTTAENELGVVVAHSESGEMALLPHPYFPWSYGLGLIHCFSWFPLSGKQYGCRYFLLRLE
uniref:Exosome component 1 n=1 Tax=Macaca mulatta TaxID=9544 RepID=A0A1D5R2I6_MACMU